MSEISLPSAMFPPAIRQPAPAQLPDRGRGPRRLHPGAPVRGSSPWDLDNVVVFPHIAGGPAGYSERVLARVFVDNLARFGAGEALRKPVDLAPGDENPGGGPPAIPVTEDGSMPTPTPTLAINGPRLWESLMASARIGPGRIETGLRRLALTDADREMRDLFVRWCREAGCAVIIDRMGSIFARRAGADDTLPPVVMGSHLDTQIAGGRFDGILGVLAGLEVVRTLNDAGVRTRRPLEVVCWTNEEGARFAPPMLASAVFGGVRSLEWALARTDAEGRTVGEELRRIGYAGEAPVGGRPLDAYFELHIEQGPILDEKGIPLGVVTGGFEVRGAVVEVHGETAHAGPTPMAQRRNALVGAAMLVVAVNEIGFAYAPEGKATPARLEAWPNLPGILSDWARLTLDVRHPEAGEAERMLADVRRAMADCARRAQVDMAIVETWQFGSERFDPELVALIRRTAMRLEAPSLDMLSQAGHDAYYVSRVAPTAMIFTPCERGISHNERESCTLEDCAPGVNVLLHAVLERANR